MALYQVPYKKNALDWAKNKNKNIWNCHTETRRSKSKRLKFNSSSMYSKKNTFHVHVKYITYTYVLANAVVCAGCEVPCCIITLDATKE